MEGLSLGRLLTQKSMVGGGAEARSDAGQDASSETLTGVQTESESRVQHPWNVIALDDPVNLMSYVAYVFQKLFGFSQEKAQHKMMEVHDDGRSVVASEERERAEFFVSRLHAYGLQATIEQSES
ncbi:MAG: ATP-dependent Clp protease adaptor protein ClpS [Pseudohongiellaceae bacterium]|jgi:ATP-dependent Clp protease adaptor protein ClpS